MSRQPIPKAPLNPLPVIQVPFERIALDFVDPLARTTWGARYLLVIVDYATRYPEAVPMRNMTSAAVARVLMQFFAQIGLPREILTDQGSPFTSNHLRYLCRAL